jgi:hypothetical protein
VAQVWSWIERNVDLKSEAKGIAETLQRYVTGWMRSAFSAIVQIAIALFALFFFFRDRVAVLRRCGPFYLCHVERWITFLRGSKPSSGQLYMEPSLSLPFKVRLEESCSGSSTFLHHCRDLCSFRSVEFNDFVVQA